MVCRCLLEQMPENCEIAFILNPKLSSVELLAAICDEFRISYPEGTTSIKDLVDRLNDFLLSIHEKHRRAILIIEEAQNLTVEVLEQVRLLTNLETSQRKLLQIIMLGQPELRETLAKPELRQLSQRITARYHLGPLAKKEISAYVNHRLSVAGLVRGELFPRPIVKALGRLTGGVPRLLNIICDRALLGTYIEGKGRIDKRTLVRAAREVTGSKIDKGKQKRKICLWVLTILLDVLIAAGVLFHIQKPIRNPGNHLSAGERSVAAQALDTGSKPGDTFEITQRWSADHMYPPHLPQLYRDILQSGGKGPFAARLDNQLTLRGDRREDAGQKNEYDEK